MNKKMYEIYGFIEYITRNFNNKIIGDKKVFFNIDNESNIIINFCVELNNKNYNITFSITEKELNIDYLKHYIDNMISTAVKILNKRMNISGVKNE